MQKKYDESLAVWKRECVKEGGYPMFGKIYDRHLSWDDKLAAMDSRMQRKYLEWSGEEEKKEVSPEKKAAKAAVRAKRKAE